MERKREADLFLEPEERQTVAFWKALLEQDAEKCFSDAEHTLACVMTKQTASEIAFADATEVCHAAIAKLWHRVERMTALVPSPSGVFLTDAERMAAYRTATALLSDMEPDALGVEGALGALLSVRERQGKTNEALLDVELSLDALCRAAWERGTEDRRITDCRRTLDVLERKGNDLARQVDCAVERMRGLLQDVLPKFGTQVSKIADFGGRGASCRPLQLRQELLSLAAILKRMNED